MPHLGDVYVTHVLEDDVGQSQDTAVVEQSGQQPHVEAFQSDLNAGTYRFFLHQDSHPDSETVAEQRDGVSSLVQRGSYHIPFEFLSERGHFSIQSVSIPRTSSRTITGELQIRYLPDSLYQHAAYPNPIVEDNDFGVSASGVVGVSDAVDAVVEDDNGMSYLSPFDSITADTGTIDLYSVTDATYHFEHQSGSYAKPVREGSVRVYDHNGSSSSSDWTRVYRQAYFPTDGVVAENGFVRYVFDDPSDGNTHVYWYDGSNWVDAGTVNVGSSPHRLDDLNPDEVVVDLPDGEFSLGRGDVTGRFDLSGLNGFTYDTGNGDNPADSTNVASNDVYVTGDNSNISFTYMLAYPNDDVTKNTDGSKLELQNYSDGPVHVGVFPSSFTTSDTAHRAITQHNIERDLLNRREL